jgi:hypothetical protein
MKVVAAMLAIAASLGAPHIDPLVPLPVVDLECVAPRGSWIINAREVHAFIAQAKVLAASPVVGPYRRVLVSVQKFLKGTFTPKNVELIFDYGCGPGGGEFKVGDELTLYMSITHSRVHGTIGLVRYWRPASWWPE